MAIVAVLTATAVPAKTTNGSVPQAMYHVTVAPASGIPRELKTISSLRVPCARVGTTAPGQMCSASATNAQKNVIVVARLKRDAIFDRIIELVNPIGMICDGETTSTKYCILFW